MKDLTLTGISELLGLDKANVFRRAKKEKWPYTQNRRADGKIQNIYAFESLPAEIKSAWLTKLRAEQAAYLKLLHDTGLDKHRPELEIEAKGFEFHNQPEAAKATALLWVKALHDYQRIPNGQKLSSLPALKLKYPTLAINTSTIALKLKAIAHVPEHCWRFYLVTVRKPKAFKEIDPCLYQIFISDYLRPLTTVTSCYRRLELAAVARGLTIPSIRTFRRLVVRELSVAVIVYCKEGPDALEKLYPAQVRDPSGAHALEQLNIDGHKMDVMCTFEDGTVGRPLLIALQDIYSRKILGWRMCKTENKGDVLLLFGSVFKTYGIPMCVFMDNGRAFVSKWITGGVPHRFRGKSFDSDPLGVLPTLGVEVVFTRPERGQSKPIERAWQDWVVNSVCSSPECAGARTGNSTENKPFDYGSKTVSEAVLRKVIERECNLHNARTGRRTITANGSSFDATFNASYAVAPIRKMPQSDLALFMLAVEEKKLSNNGTVLDLFGNDYWTEVLNNYAGQSVIVRFDPDNLHGSVFVYTKQNVLICEAPVHGAIQGYRNVEASKVTGEIRGIFTKSNKAKAKALKKYTPEQLAAFLPASEAPELPAAKVIAPKFSERVATPLPADVPLNNMESKILEFTRRQQREAS